MPQVVKAPADVLADFKVSTKRAPIYSAREGAKRVAVPTVSDVAYVTRGAHAKDGTPVLLVQNGSTQHALALAAVGAAIAGGVLSTEEIAALTA